MVENHVGSMVHDLHEHTAPSALFKLKSRPWKLEQSMWKTANGATISASWVCQKKLRHKILCFSQRSLSTRYYHKISFLAFFSEPSHTLLLLNCLTFRTVILCSMGPGPKESFAMKMQNCPPSQISQLTPNNNADPLMELNCGLKAYPTVCCFP